MLEMLREEVELIHKVALALSVNFMYRDRSKEENILSLIHI